MLQRTVMLGCVLAVALSSSACARRPDALWTNGDTTYAVTKGDTTRSWYHGDTTFYPSKLGLSRDILSANKDTLSEAFFLPNGQLRDENRFLFHGDSVFRVGGGAVSWLQARVLRDQRKNFFVERQGPVV